MYEGYNVILLIYHPVSGRENGIFHTKNLYIGKIGGVEYEEDKKSYYNIMATTHMEGEVWL